MCKLILKLSLIFICSTAYAGNSRNTLGTGVITESVDMIELCHMYDKSGDYNFDMILFYELCPATGRFLVRTWCHVEDSEFLNRRPVRNYQNNLIEVDWHDTDKKVVRHITSRLYRESWTQIDPEQLNRKFLHEEDRVALIDPKYLGKKSNLPTAEDKEKIPPTLEMPIENYLIVTSKNE